MLDPILGKALLDLTSTLVDPIPSCCKVCNNLYEVLHTLNECYSRYNPAAAGLHTILCEFHAFIQYTDHQLTLELLYTLTTDHSLYILRSSLQHDVAMQRSCWNSLPASSSRSFHSAQGC